MIYANPVTWVTVSFCVINTPVITVAYIVTHQAALVFSSILGAAYLAILVACNTAASGYVIAYGCTYQPACCCSMATAVTQFMANCSAYQGTNNSATKRVSAALAISYGFYAAGVHGYIHCNCAVNGAGCDYRGIFICTLINYYALMAMMIVMFLMMLVPMPMMVTRLGKAAKCQGQGCKANGE
jgi:hypothetical protein